MRCMQGSTLLRAQGDLSWTNSITELLSEIRGRIDGRRAEPCGFAEVPTTWQDWRSFIRHWLFGPRAWKQTTLKSWLRCPPAAPERCRDCGKTSGPGAAFCSAQCAAAHGVLFCSKCEEPLSAEQGLCRACRLPRP